jgi:hypothetical protein
VPGRVCTVVPASGSRSRTGSHDSPAPGRSAATASVVAPSLSRRVSCVVVVSMARAVQRTAEAAASRDLAAIRMPGSQVTWRGQRSLFWTGG